MKQALIVGVGGMIGAIARYQLGGAILQQTAGWRFPLGTFVVNVAGCLVIGLLAGLVELRGLFSMEHATLSLYRPARRTVSDRALALKLETDRIGAGAALFGSMLCRGPGGECETRTLLIFLAVALFFLAISAVDAQTRRPRNEPAAFQVALQPFSSVRDAIHAVAEPAGRRAPQVVARLATAPVRIAKRLNPAATREVVRGEEVEEEELAAETEAGFPPRSRRLRAAYRAPMAEPIRVAYVTARPAPRAESPYDYDEDPDAESEPSDVDQQESYGANDEAEREPRVEAQGSKPMVAGSRAVLRNGIAYAPSHAPQAVKNAIWAANTLRRKPYVWGGGHGSFSDRGYDCSGTVSFALHGAGALEAPLPSGEFMRYGERGRGRWITVYSRRGHTFAVIAGLRLDTTDFENGGNSGPRWHADMRDTRGYVARHPARM